MAQGLVQPAYDPSLWTGELFKLTLDTLGTELVVFFMMDATQTGSALCTCSASSARWRRA